MNMNTDKHNLNKEFIKFATENIEKNERLKKYIQDEYDYNFNNVVNKKNKKIYRNERNKTAPLKKYYQDNPDILEAGIDEAGRGPMFGRVYTACVILPRTNFNFTLMKDSKRFSSKKKIMEAYNYIIGNCIDYSVSYKDEKYIDKMNIREATLSSMRDSIDKIKVKPNLLLVDGCDFRPYNNINYECIEGGDNWYCSIAAASILAKVSRDLYIEELCEKEPILNERYGILKNKGYGTKQHILGLKTFGITEYHRKTFGICKTL